MRQTRVFPMLFLLLLPLISPVLNAVEFPEQVEKAKNTIKGQIIYSHIDFLASSFCRGREVGDKGMDLAEKYIRTILKSASLPPGGESGDYFQNVRLRSCDLGAEGRLEIMSHSNGNEGIHQAQLIWDYLPISLSVERRVMAPLVFAGYGITAPEYQYDDYQNLKSEGKIVLVMRHEPKEREETDLFEGRKNSKHGTLLSKILNAQKHGAIGILFFNDPVNHQLRDPGETSGTYWPSLRKERMKNEEDFQFLSFKPEVELQDADYGVRIPALAIDFKLAEELVGAEVSLQRIQESIDKSLKPQSFMVKDKTATMQVDFHYEPVKAHNIAIKILGSDPELKEEVVLIGAHSDHVGKDNRGRVFGGADDNASGTAAVMEIAKAFYSLEQKPKRTILCLLFTAEEKGLLGSRFYVDHPLVPLEKTYAMINLDMIGRNDLQQISVAGRFQFPKLYEFVKQANETSINMEINFTIEELLQNSDHYPFMRHNIPSVFFNSGLHDQLHRPEDTSDRIVMDKVEKVARLAFLTAFAVADAPKNYALK